MRPFESVAGFELRRIKAASVSLARDVGQPPARGRRSVFHRFRISLTRVRSGDLVFDPSFPNLFSFSFANDLLEGQIFKLVLLPVWLKKKGSSSSTLPYKPTEWLRKEESARTALAGQHALFFVAFQYHATFPD